METLVISDLHLGARGGRALLHTPEVRGALAERLRTVDRLVLLGDVIELREEPVWRVLADVAPVLGPLTDALGSHADVIILAGNHDHELIAPWMVQREAEGTPPPLGLESPVDWRHGDPLERLVELWGAGGASVRVVYPGIWLRDDVYATHGHYLDRHATLPAFERLAAGAMARYLKQSLADLRTPEDYESVLAPIYAWMFQISQHSAKADTDGQKPGSSHASASAQIWKTLQEGQGLTKFALSSGITAATGLLSAAGLGPLKSDLSGEELYRSGVRGFADVVDCLAIEAEYALYGHTHRAGPLPGDDPEVWTAENGTRMINTGCWVSEAAIVGPELASTAYRPGFAVRLDDSLPRRPPELVNVLERAGVLPA